MYARAGMLSKDGRCKTFDAGANGYARGEGVGSFVMLQSSSVSGVSPYLGSRVQSDGKSASLTAPSGKAQARMLGKALAVAGAEPLDLVEAHGTGTKLGDPTELAGLERSLAVAAPNLGGAKANLGHTEPVAGLLGLLALVRSVRQSTGTANAKLRVLNRMLNPCLRNMNGRIAAQSSEVLITTTGVSSFGYSGTIAHAILAHVVVRADFFKVAEHRLVYKRTPFLWREIPHPFLEMMRCQEASNSSMMIYESSAHGALFSLVADHIVQGRVVFPAAGYIEMAHAASVKAPGSEGPTALNAVFFLLPLTLSDAADDARITVRFNPCDSFEVSSTAASGSLDIHSSGSLSSNARRKSSKPAFETIYSQCVEAVDIMHFYDALHQSGLNYGPTFRAITHASKAPMGLPIVAALRPRKSRRGIHLHPADLDAALQLSVASSALGSTNTRVPFALDGALVEACAGSLWASVEAQGDEATSLTLASRSNNRSAQLDGFKARELRATAAQQPWYSTEWHASGVQIASTVDKPSSLLLLMNDECFGRKVISDRIGLREASAAVIALSTCCGMFDRSSLLLASAALEVVQVSSQARPVWFVTAGVHRISTGDAIMPSQSGSWGVARTARVEAMLPVNSVDVVHRLTRASLFAIATSVLSISDQESVLRAHSRHLPRLRQAPYPMESNIQLGFLPRGALSNLRIEMQPDLSVPSSNAAEVMPSSADLYVRAVGLNFRDVLNVLGEYPGDPGPPGIDCSGIICRERGLRTLCVGHSCFGLGTGALASITRTDGQLLAAKPSTLTFEQISTLPITWSTVHVALSRAILSAYCRYLIHAAAGGVGLKAVEYASWLRADLAATAGGQHKHQQLRDLGVLLLCSSRDSSTLCCGISSLYTTSRHQGVINSLSLDFISISLALTGEYGTFHEIGKRGIWAYARHAAAASHSIYGAIAVDTDTADQPSWMSSLLSCLGKRAQAGVLACLPLQSFDMETQAELAFRTLQSGQNTGKIVIRLARRKERPFRSAHIITGGTGGLGILTARWLGESGASRLVLASRTGKRSPASAGEWTFLMKGQAKVDLQQCDSADDCHVQSLIARVQNFLSGIWHAAGVLVDGALPSQTASTMQRVYAPKAHGAWALHSASASTPLQASLHFSSVAALLGNPGQTNYSSANACLDALATSQRSGGQIGASVQWGPWGHIGMAAEGVAGEKLAGAGFGLISPDHGLRAMRTAVQAGCSSVLGVVPLNWSTYLGTLTEVPHFLQTFAARTSSATQPLATILPVGISLDGILEVAKRTAGGDVNSDVPLMDAGIDSLGAVELRNQLQRMVGTRTTLPSTIVFDYPTARSLVAFLSPRTELDREAQQHPRESNVALVLPAQICGSACVIPGGAATPKEAWRVSISGIDVLSEVPALRWEAFELPPTTEPIATRRRHGGFVQSEDCFDNTFFGLSKSEVAAMDPQQRILLTLSYSALHDGHMNRRFLMSSLTGVYVGISILDFEHLLQSPALGSTVYAATGSSHSIASGRISFMLGTHGPCLSIDTACSAALTACHVASGTLMKNECDQALAAGVNLVLTPVVSSRFALAGMTSPRGRSHTFDRRADGYGRAEAGCGVGFAAKVERESSMVGSSIRQDGRSASLTAPNGQAQAGLVRETIRVSGCSASEWNLAEAHGTGTALGDPIEAGSLTSAVLSSRGAEAPPLAVGGVKSSIGHAEPAAGMTGLLKLSFGLQSGVAAPNAQLRVLNPLLDEHLRNTSCALAMQASELSPATQAFGGVSSFGYSGTIAHAVVRHTSEQQSEARPPRCLLTSKRRIFSWRQPAHPFTQRRLPSSSDVGAIVFRSPALGALHALVADHVVHDRVIFPAVGYLEMAREASGAALQGIFFLQPLAVETPGLIVQCTVGNGRFEVSSTEDEGVEDEASVNCSGTLTSHADWQSIDFASVRGSACAPAAEIGDVYQSFAAVGLRYGPSFRRLAQGWGGQEHGTARLRARSTGHVSTRVHPADLDDALCTSSLITPDGGNGGGATQLPFAVDMALLQAAPGLLWAAAARKSADNVSVQLSALTGPSQAQIGGFKSRALRIEAPTQRHLYATAWIEGEAVEASNASKAVLVIGDNQVEECKRLASRAPREELSVTLSSGEWATIAAVTATQRGILDVVPLFALEVVLALVQMPTMPTTSLLFLTMGAQTVSRPAHAGLWGLARSARAEASLPVQCVDASTRSAVTLAPSLTDCEAIICTGARRHVPRLQEAPPLYNGLVRLHFHARGAISNLFLEPSPVFPPLSAEQVVLHVRSVGLNFRDVLNVLGEYPGDPGPPGGDSSGVINSTDTNRIGNESVFGLGHAPLACVAIAARAFVTQKPTGLSFEEASTLPVTWSTTHTALQRARLSSNGSFIIQAAAGGVGLKAGEYAHWLRAFAVGTAGRSHKHTELRATGLSALCSSRDSTAFAFGAAQLVGSGRFHAVLNSLSLDFIVASFALLRDGGAFEEIGKRGVWSSERHLASVRATSYCAIALDADMAFDPVWMHGVLQVLAARADAGTAHSLPFESFDMETQHELAFRTLQAGLNLGKIVVRVASRETCADGSHVLTGGTGGLGLLTGRWLAQRGAQKLVLASRSGALARDTATEWAALCASGVETVLEQCDAGEAWHVRRLVALAPRRLHGVWHAAGALADALLPNQTAASMAFSYAPKTHGAWQLHSACLPIGVRANTSFSSVVALLGGAGQANYGAANTCLDALAKYRRSQGTAGSSVQWGAWAEIGMAARGAASERMAVMASSSGFGRIGLAQGLAALGTATRDVAPPVLGLLPIVWSRYLDGGAAVPAFLSRYTPRSEPSSAGAVRGLQPAVSAGVSLELVLEMVKRTAGGSVDADAPMMEAGVDSLGAVELRNQLQSAVGTAMTLPSTLIFDYPTARSIFALFHTKSSPCIASSSAYIPVNPTLLSPSEFALTGNSALFPGNMTSSASAQAAFASGAIVIEQVPLARWDVYAQPALPEPIASRVRHLGFVCNAQLMDNAAYAVPSSEAAAMDPCQRLVLEHGYAALYDAEFDRGSLARSLTGVFLGFASTEFNQVLAASPLGGSVYAATGASVSIAAGRVSYTFGLHGPCVSYDTACSAALAASHAAICALRLGESTNGLIASVQIMLAPGIGTGFAVAGMTSPRGRSHTFDRRADGYARGEACGATVVECASKNEINLSFMGSAVRQDGRSASLTAPNGQAQAGMITAALKNASVSVASLLLGEAHGTGTALGDPIEAGSLTSAVLSSRGAEAPPLAVGGVKSSIGHAEPAAGMTGLLKLSFGLQSGVAAPNAQLRVLNPLLDEHLRNTSCALAMQASELSPATQAFGGVSSFGYSGTIAHAVVRHTSEQQSEARPPRCLLTSKRRIFSWRQPAHPFTQRRLPSSSDVGAIVFRSPALGALHALVADHVVHDRVIFPAVGYLEMAREASGAALQGIFFLQPLAVETPGLIVQCTVGNGRFEVSSTEDEGVEDEASVNCSGTLTSHADWQSIDFASVRGSACAPAAEIGDVYQSFAAVGLRYGPSFRRLAQGWGGQEHGTARLRARSTGHVSTRVHPADLDDALCTSSLITPDGGNGGGATQLPFAVDMALLQAAPGLLWAAAARKSADNVSVQLSALTGPSQAQIGGFKSRALRIEAPTQRHLYATAWIEGEAVEASNASKAVLVIGDNQVEECKRLASRAPREELSVTLSSGEWATIAAVTATQRGILDVVPLFALEVVLALVQMPTMPTTSLLFLTMGAQTVSRPAHAGLWGLARSARAEASLPVQCVDASTRSAVTLAPSLTDCEAIICTGARRHVPRLQEAPPLYNGLVRLHFHARGAISNLFLEPSPVFPPLSAEQVVLHVRSVGLNFRDVLNVLGEYPGDPGPPGGDSSGVINSTDTNRIGNESVFGLGHAPLACVAIAARAFVTQKPTGLSFEEASTLPVTWSTTHTALQRARLSSNGSFIIQAAAGGVGLKAGEYAHWLRAFAVGTAGRSHKHTELRATGLSALCSSRDSTAFAFGAAQLVGSGRFHAVLNSLSLDFIVASFALLRDGGAFEEIGKRGVWSSERHLASVRATSYCAIALDADMAFDPVWMHGVLQVLAARADAGTAHSLPFESFDMETQHELAFRTLQAGLNLGKIVVRVASRETCADGSHVLTGGTGGLGLLTGRWLAQRGAQKLVLASRSGALARDTATEWAALCASGVETVLEQCDAGEAWHVRRLVALAPRRLHGVWHAAGALADALLPNQTAASMAFSYAPKTHGAWQLHSACLPIGVRANTSFSSVVALLGGAGQANYGAANTCLDALAKYRRSQGTAGSSVQWGAWAEIGMAARGAASERMAVMASSSGFGRIGLAQGLAALGTATRDVAPPVLGLLPIVWSRYLDGGAAVPAFLSRYTPRSEPSSAGAVRGLQPAVSAGVSLELVLEMVKRTAGGSVDADAPMMEAGVDSLGAVELRNQLQSAVGTAMTLPSTLIFDYPTARQLALSLPSSDSPSPPPLITTSDPPPDLGELPSSDPVAVSAAVSHGRRESTQLSEVSDLPYRVRSRRPRVLMLHGRAADGALMQRLLTAFGWTALPIDFVTVTALHPCMGRADLYPSTVTFENGTHDWGLTFGAGLGNPDPNPDCMQDRLACVTQSVEDIERILASDPIGFDGIGGICDGSLIASLVATRLPANSRVSFYINMCGGPWIMLPESMQTGTKVTIPSLHLIGTKDEVFSQEQLLGIPTIKCTNPLVVFHSAGHTVPMVSASIHDAVDALLLRAEIVASAKAVLTFGDGDDKGKPMPGEPQSDGRLVTVAEGAISRPAGPQGADDFEYDSLALLTGGSGPPKKAALAHMTGLRGFFIMFVVLHHFVPRPYENVGSTNFIDHVDVAKGLPVQDFANKIMDRIPAFGMPYLFVASGFGLHLTYRKKKIHKLFDFYLDRIIRMANMIWLCTAIEFFFDRLAPKALQPYFQPSSTVPLSRYLQNSLTLGTFRPLIIQVHNLLTLGDPWPHTGYLTPTASVSMNAWLAGPSVQNLPTILHLWFLSYTVICTLLYPTIARIVKRIDQRGGAAGLAGFVAAATIFALLPVLIDKGETRIFLNGSSFMAGPNDPWNPGPKSVTNRTDELWTDEAYRYYVYNWEGPIWKGHASGGRPDHQTGTRYYATAWQEKPAFRMPWFQSEPSVFWPIGYVLWFMCGVATVTFMVRMEEWNRANEAEAAAEAKEAKKQHNDVKEPYGMNGAAAMNGKGMHEESDAEAMDIETGSLLVSSPRNPLTLRRRRACGKVRAVASKLCLAFCKKLASHEGRGYLADLCVLSILLPAIFTTFDYYRFTMGYYGTYGWNEFSNWNRAYIPVFCLFLYGAASQGGAGYFAQMFASDVLTGLGDISLAIYALQATVARMCAVRWLRRGPNQENYCKDLSYYFQALPGRLWGSSPNEFIDKELKDTHVNCINATGEQVTLLIVALLVASSFVTYKVEPYLDEKLRALITKVRPFVRKRYEYWSNRMRQGRVCILWGRVCDLLYAAFCYIPGTMTTPHNSAEREGLLVDSPPPR